MIMNKTSLFKYCLVALVLLLLTISCQSSKKLYQTFYSGEEGVQYFLKPLQLISDNKKEKIFVDFTFRHKDSLNVNVITNYSIHTIKLIKKVDSLVIRSGNNIVHCMDNELLFAERKSSFFKSRFTTKIILSDLSKLMKDSSWRFEVYSNGNNWVFYPSKKSKKKIQALAYNVFVIVD